MNRQGALGLALAASLAKVWQTDRISVYEIPDALPRAYVAYNTVPVESSQAALEALGNPNFDEQSMVVIENTSARISNPPKRPLTPATITQYSANHLSLAAEAQADGILVLTDTYFPGWRVWVDGVERPVLQANYRFRGVTLPAGRHSIEFKYDSQSFELSADISLATLSLLFIGPGKYSVDKN